ncbi:MAG: polysaccharide lyase family protein, partial [Armatimonadetes bacterium]|nr:polysaccharide lyase family protein [Armatimonadota bacterium]
MRCARVPVTGFLLLAANSALLALVAVGARGQEQEQAGQLLWRICVPDRAYRELAIAGRYPDYVARFPNDVTYRVGESAPARDWPFIHPGPDDVWAGWRPHVFRVEFDLTVVPAGACRLTLDLVNPHYGSPPVLEVNVNERRAYRVKLPAGGTDEALTNPAAGRPLSIPIFFPAGHLVAGRNLITITTTRGSWLLYDAITLQGGLAMPAGPELAFVDAQSTMFFRRE